LRCGLPVYCEKPLAHTLGEARELRMMARESGLSTQLGTQIHASSTYRQVVEAVRAGAVGRITAVDCWQTKSWGGGKLTPGAKAPPNLNWNLWLCKKPSVPYIEGIHPANWRRYWAYGSGTLGDMGCHIMDLPVWALGLAPTADMPGSGSKPLNIEVRTEGPPLDPVGTPEWLEVTWAIPGAAGEGKDPLVLRWFDGGRKSPFVQEIGAKDKQDYHGRFSVCFQGTEGAILANYDEMLVWPPARACEWYGRTTNEAMGITTAGGQPAAQRPVLTPTPSSPAALKVTPLDPSLGHHAEWVQAVKDRTPESPLCNFEYSGRLTELVLSGMEAFRAGRPAKVTIA
jgi:predicted dehydrogenase